MPSPGSAISSISPQRIFGFAISPGDAKTIARSFWSPRLPYDGVGLVVTPNLQHIVDLRHNVAFAQAYRNAAVIVCDGFPVYYYAAMCGIFVQHVTGCDLLHELMSNVVTPDQRMFFVVDSDQTAAAVIDWGRGKRIPVDTAVPPRDFENDFELSERLIDRIHGHRTSILVFGIGAPKSEIWISSHLDRLPACWALCVGQAVRVALGLTRRAPKLIRNLNSEWLFRVIQEPRRLTRRYLSGPAPFLLAIAEDRLDAHLRRLAWRRTVSRPTPTSSNLERSHNLGWIEKMT
jgi:N-acetylglucosaminyldiphosphoundecaprenol N-acetyl-beta-D-mannosaminyltransferase